MGTPKTMWVDESERWAPLWVDADSKKCQICVVQMVKNLAHSFYHILYQPKGVPISGGNFSGSGGKLQLESIKVKIHKFCFLCPLAHSVCHEDLLTELTEILEQPG